MPKSNTPRLSDTQLVILSSAAQREDALAVLPETLKGGAAKAAVTKLLGLGFVKEVPVKRGAPAWRTDEEEKPRADAAQGRREPRRHGRGHRLAAAHHAGGPDRPA